MTTEKNPPASELRDAIARRVAAELAPEVGPNLPMYVEKLIALGEDAVDDVPARMIADASVIALAGVLLSAITIVAGRIDRYQDEKRRAQEEQRSREDAERRQGEQDRMLRVVELVLTREALEREIVERVRFPEEIPARVRGLLLQKVVDEGLEEVKRREEKQ